MVGPSFLFLSWNDLQSHKHTRTIPSHALDSFPSTWLPFTTDFGLLIVLSVFSCPSCHFLETEKVFASSEKTFSLLSFFFCEKSGCCAGIRHMCLSTVTGWEMHLCDEDPLTISIFPLVKSSLLFVILLSFSDPSPPPPISACLTAGLCGLDSKCRFPVMIRRGPPGITKFVCQVWDREYGSSKPFLRRWRFFTPGHYC